MDLEELKLFLRIDTEEEDTLIQGLQLSAEEYLLNAGVTVLTTVHGSSLIDIEQRPVIRDLIGQKIFERLILLGRSRGAGTIEAIVDGRSGRTLMGKIP